MDHDETPPMRRTLRFGEALVMIGVLLVALVVVDQRQESRFDLLEGQVGRVDVSSGGGVGSADPQLCWLLGVVAASQGDGARVDELALAGESGDCARHAAHGASGLPFDTP